MQRRRQAGEAAPDDQQIAVLVADERGGFDSWRYTPETRPDGVGVKESQVGGLLR